MAYPDVTIEIQLEDTSWQELPTGFQVDIKRGRSRALDTIPTGTCTIRFHNQDRSLDPDFSIAGASFLLLESGDFLLLEDGSSKLVLESEDAGDFGEIRPGKAIRVKAGTVVVFQGTVDEWNYSWTVDKQAIAELNAYDALGRLAAKELDEFTPTAQQMPGPRISAILARSEVSMSGDAGTINTGSFQLSNAEVAQNTNALNYCQLVAASDLAWFFATRTNSLNYRDRSAFASGSVLATFGDDGVFLPFHELTVQFGGDLHYTRAVVTRSGGLPQTYLNTDLDTKYDVRSLSRSTLNASDSDAASIAEYYAVTYGTPTAFVSSLTIMPELAAFSAVRDTIRGLEIGNLIRVVWTPTGIGAASDQTLAIEGVRHVFNRGEPHRMILSLSDRTATAGTQFILDSASFGLLDSNRLGI